MDPAGLTLRPAFARRGVSRPSRALLSRGAFLRASRQQRRRSTGGVGLATIRAGGSPISAACAAGSNGRGCTFTFSYYGDAFDNPFGGVKQGPGYDGRFGIIMDGDLDKLAGWSGAKFHASIHNIFGTQFSATHLDNLMLVSGVRRRRRSGCSISGSSRI